MKGVERRIVGGSRSGISGFGSRRLFDFQGIPSVDLRITPSESVLVLEAERAFDRVIAGAVILCVLIQTVSRAARGAKGSVGPTFRPKSQRVLHSYFFSHVCGKAHTFRSPSQ